MIDTIYANVAAARLELSEIKDPPMQVRDALKRLADVVELITNDHSTEARDAWIEKEAIRLHVERDMTGRFWSALGEDERKHYRDEARAEWDQD